jgi:suppressor for copper-sensitivity B
VRACEVRMGFLASAAGILLSSCCLPAYDRSEYSGAAIGWGIQFSNPCFWSAIVLVTFAANLWGLFEIPFRFSPIPSAGLLTAACRAVLRAVLSHLVGDTLLAPFLGTAVGFSVSRHAGNPLRSRGSRPRFGPAVSGGGGGPQIASPASTGHVDDLLRQVLGGALALTAIWLLTVRGSDTGRCGLYRRRPDGW